MKMDFDSVVKVKATTHNEKNVQMITDEQAFDNLEALFIPLQSNDPVEQFVRRT